MPRPALTLVLLLFASTPGCSSDIDACEVVCAKNAECQADSPGKDTCVALCVELSDRDSYATAIEHTAECYDEEDRSCADLAGGVCDYQPED
ncbi:hypothetical protein WME90_22985 [Sorangium sp. So ce375]|uniref:hypothetical protein n=1 Tax=Sorangium sp. So ce375 TaxID=3133306 RepID=UPI003F5B6E3E